MPRLSVVVPIYNVEQYLAPCLDSLIDQTFRDLEVVMVDDGSTDGSAAIAESYVDRDERFKLVTRPNGGLSAARNTGLEYVTGDYLAFLDSDDVLPPNAYELLVGSLEKTGSDFATGKVRRLTRNGTRAATFLREAFRETRLKTHILRFRPLLADRIAWNKVFRRSFWDSQGLRFPEGRINEDIPVILPLHFSARSVDVIAETVYLWRLRETGGLSITEQRAELYALEMRLQAVTDVHDWLATHDLEKARRWYDRSLVADDLKYYLNVLDRASDEYRETFLQRVNALLDRADDDIFDGLPAIERLKWHLVRRRRMSELLEVLRFEREDMAERPPVRDGRHWLGDYPFRGDPRLDIPDSVYRLDSELGIDAHVDAIRLDGDRLRIDGWAYIEGIGAGKAGAQRVHVALLRPGRFRRLRYLLASVRFKVAPVHRPDANRSSAQSLVDVSWTGFTATLDPRRLRRAGRWRDGRWELFVTVTNGRLRRAKKLFSFPPFGKPAAVELPATGSMLARVVVSGRGEVGVEVTSRWAAVRSARVEDGILVLSGVLHGPEQDGIKLQIAQSNGADKRRYALERSQDGFIARLPLAELAGNDRPGADDEADDVDDEAVVEPAWELYVSGSGRPIRVALPADTPAHAWNVGEREVALSRTREGDAALVVRAPRALLTAARWDGGGLAVEGAGVDRAGELELVLFSAARNTQHTFELHRGGDERFSAVATPAATASLAGELPLPEGHWRLCVRQAGDRRPTALSTLTPSSELAARLPLDTVVDHKRFTLAAAGDGSTVLFVDRDLDDDERGPYQQRQLRRTAYAPRRGEPLTEAVVFTSFRGRQYSDSPRAIHEELVRRDAPLNHFWVVRDGACRVPATATVLREGSREHYEVMARARYVVTNDHFPEWFERRPEQLCVQTWHGTPLKRLGFDVSALRDTMRKFEHGWATQVRNWQYVVSPNRFATPILERAYLLEDAEMLETGYPRDDILAGPGREAAGRRLREQLGLPMGARTVLYLPTFRDHVKDRRGRYRLDLRLDIERLRAALGPDTVLLIRKHHYIVDQIPVTPDGFVRDVSSYPDGNELLLAADVLLTDYSSAMVDFANTGRPMLFFAYDLETYRNEIRGFYIDYEETVPGPVLTTSDEVAEALRDIDRVQADHATRYDTFVAKFCEFDDGGASGRVVDEVFGR